MFHSDNKQQEKFMYQHKDFFLKKSKKGHISLQLQSKAWVSSQFFVRVLLALT